MIPYIWGHSLQLIRLWQERASCIRSGIRKSSKAKAIFYEYGCGEFFSSARLTIDGAECLTCVKRELRLRA